MNRMNINSRVLAALEYVLTTNKEVTKSRFAQLLGMKPSSFTEILKARSNAGSDLMALLVHSFGISAHWLLTGEGEMIKNTAEAPETHSDAFATLLKTIQQQAEEIGYLKAQINQKGHTAQNAHSDTIAAAG